MGKCYIAIAQMYASSAKNCGSDNFSQRAVYWLASSEALKASKVDPNLKKAANNSSKTSLSITVSVHNWLCMPKKLFIFSDFIFSVLSIYF